MKAVQTQEAGRATIGPLQVVIILLTLTTALIHLVVLNALMLSDPAFGHIDLKFTLNGLGYLALLAALYLPLPIVSENRSLVRYALMGFAALTILAWVFLGRPYTSLGYVTKLIELALIVLLFVDSRQ